jgi:hypothetical protein
METEGSLLQSQVPATCPYPHPYQPERVFYKTFMVVKKQHNKTKTPL